MWLTNGGRLSHVDMVFGYTFNISDGFAKGKRRQRSPTLPQPSGLLLTSD